MAEEKKFVIELNERQLRALSHICDMYHRLIEGQLDIALQPVLEQAWEKHHPEWREDKGAWYAMRAKAEAQMAELLEQYWSLIGGRYYGIHYDGYADMIWDMHQVMRHALWREQTAEQKERTRWTVDAYPASQIGEEPLIDVKTKEL